MDATERVHLGGYPAPLRACSGCASTEFWPLPAGGRVPLDVDGRRHTGTSWSEWIELEGAEVVATFAGGELAGRPAVTRHAYGSGVAWYLGTRPEPALMRQLLDRVRAEAGVGPVLPGLPDEVQAVRRHGDDGSYLLLLNHGPDPVTVTLPAPRIDLLAETRRPIDSVTLPRRGVAVLRIG